MLSDRCRGGGGGGKVSERKEVKRELLATAGGEEGVARKQKRGKKGVWHLKSQSSRRSRRNVLL